MITKSFGIDSLKQLKFYQPKSDLCQFQGTLEEYFGQVPPATINEARAKIEELTGINRSPTRVRHFLKSLGLSYRKVGMIPAKVDVAVQEDIHKKHLEPRLTEAKAGKRA